MTYTIDLAENLRNLMRKNVVEFTFKKKDGTIRHARGTRNLEIASVVLGYAVRIPKGEEQPNSYYDLDKDGWRSYIPSNLISIDRITPIPSFGEMVREVYGNEKPKAEEPKKEEPKNEGKPTYGYGSGIGGFAMGLGFGDIPNEKGEDEPKGKGGIPIGLGVGGGASNGEIRRIMDAIGKDIELPKGKELEKLARAIGIPNGMGGMVGTPTHQPNGVALPISGVVGEQMTIDDFAKLVAKYVVAELIDRLTK